MKEKLMSAREAVQTGKMEAAAEAVAAIKSLPITGEKVFDLSGIDCNTYRAGRLVYPVYTAYETWCNKKEGYPDIVEQLRIWNRKLDQEYTFEHAALFLDTLMETIVQMSPEIYEYYRELSDMFKTDVKRVIADFYCDGSFSQGEGSGEGEGQIDGVEMDGQDLEKILKGAIKKACENDILLTEKYQVFSD